MRCSSTRLCPVVLTVLSVLYLWSNTVNAAPVVHSSTSQDAAEPVLSDHEGVASRMIHLTARPNSSFQLGKWSVTFFSIQFIRTLPTNLIELYNQIMHFTAPYDHAAPQNSYFEFRFGQLSLIFQSTDGRIIPFDVIYAFAEQALERVLRDWTGLYRGVSSVLISSLPSTERMLSLTTLQRVSNLISSLELRLVDVLRLIWDLCRAS